jgi:hypothetical protein
LHGEALITEAAEVLCSAAVYSYSQFSVLPEAAAAVIPHSTASKTLHSGVLSKSSTSQITYCGFLPAATDMNKLAAAS